jgi:4-amino-4-deoxy-L-arabinose transferase-like glycosyltransferase
MEGPDSPATSQASKHPWLPPLLVTIVVTLTFGLAPTRLPLQGEETCRVLHGIEMAATGDWLFATIQGVPIMDRPPLQYWTFAVIHRWIHPLDPLTIRLVMFAITLATSLMVWRYAHRFLSAPAALLAGVAYPTLGHVLDLGRRAETDAQFTLLCAASLLAWHTGYSRGRNRYLTWIFGGFLAALAALTKGLQAPVAFFGATYFFLLLLRDWRWLLHPSNLAGILTFLAAVAVWQVPFYMETGWQGVWLTWFNPGASRLGGDWAGLLRHKVTFPLVVLGATLPWSPLLLGLLRWEFWNLGSSGRSAVVFLLCGIAAILVPVWLSPGGHQRYVMPMYPLLAVLCGAVVHQGLSLAPSGFLRRLWRDYVRVLAGVVAGITIVFLVATAFALFSVHEWVLMLAQPWWQIILLVVLIVPAAGFLIHQSSSNNPRDALWVIFLSGALVGLLFNGPLINSLAQAAVDVRPDVNSLYHRIPQGARLMSIGPADPQFPRVCGRWTRLLYYYPEPIPLVRHPWSAEDVPEDLEYFVIEARRGEPTVLPFEWEEIGRLNMDRIRHDDPENFVLIGRRLQPSGGTWQKSRR